MNKTKLALEAWQTTTNSLMELFVEKYFGKDAEYYWIADCIGEVLYVNDRFFDLKDIVDFIQYRYTADQMFDYYDYRLDLQEKGKSPINIKNWKRLKK
jgi:hypothetical protein